MQTCFLLASTYGTIVTYWKSTVNDSDSVDYRKTNYKNLGSHSCNNALTTFDLTKRYKT
jgi:hypothetical protein